ncbi:AraC family transcriptional regulator [Lentilactobacillus sp. TOM.63]|uniref:helix-turn-helix domain-containing protein n=1 Tax=Lentilactobacillus sp. TOM.63 TaxID=3055077 RepID=UPI0025A24A8B|nr:AraC family transcriptional regulator [Lentilactobacillus sp. TOM.63]MDM7515700.1 AraC family transcriptional regulator [Lentilactobacillus sp. TOM.63]
MKTNVININNLTTAKYRSIANFLNLFSRVSLIDTYLYFTEGVFLSGGNAYSSKLSLTDHISFTENDVFCLIPISDGNSVIGFIISNSTNVSSKRIEFIRQTFVNYFNHHDEIDLSILKPLFIHDIGEINNLPNFFSTTNTSFQRLETNSRFNNSEQTIDVVIKFVNNNINRSLSLQAISDKVNLAPTYITTEFKKRFHINITEYITNLRIKNACNQLLTTNNSIREISEELGFVRTSYFSRVFKNHTGLSPLQYRQMNQLADKA